MGSKRKIQAGIMHVYFRGNNRFTVFYDDADRIEFLKRCEKYAKSNKTVIEEFVLMDNHVHLQIITPCVSKFIKELLQSYSRWYNQKYKGSDRIFKSPFSCATKNTEEWRINSSFYILQNPVKAGICPKAEDYKWSSVHFHYIRRDKEPVQAGQLDNNLWFDRHEAHKGKNKDFEKNIEYNKHTKSQNISKSFSYYRSLSKYITIDTRFTDLFFISRKAFLAKLNNSYINLNHIITGANNWERTPLHEISKMLTKYLNRKTLNDLSVREREATIIHLLSNTTGSLIQIAGITHESYEYVKKLYRRAILHNKLKTNTLENKE